MLGPESRGVPYKIKPKPGDSSRALTNLIPYCISIYDVADVEGFVNDMVRITKLRMGDQDERDELVSEGIALLFAMARNFKPHMEGYDKPGKFSGYCAAFLPRKISNAWHKMHPEHLQETVELEDGRKVRRYKYGKAPMSLESLTSRWDHSSGDTTKQELEDGGIRTVGDFIAG